MHRFAAVVPSILPILLLASRGLACGFARTLPLGPENGDARMEADFADVFDGDDAAGLAGPAEEPQDEPQEEQPYEYISGY